MEPKCLVCNGRTPSYLYKNHIKDVFSDSNVLPSKKKLLATLEEILDRSLDKQTCHSKILCLKCYKTCVEYDGYKSKVIVFKRIISEDFTKTVNNLDQLKNKDEKASNKIVVPASKLVPVPADFQLNFSSLSGFGQLANPLPNDQVANGGQVTITNVYDKTKATPLINLKVTIGSSVFTQSVKTSTVKIGKSLETIDNINSVMTAKEGGWSANLVPNEIFSNNDETNQNSDEDNSENGDDSDRSDEKVVKDNSQKVNPASDENEMELDLENIKTEDPLTDDTQYINVSMQDDGSMVSADGNFVLGKLKIINEGEDGEQHTLILDGENGSILEMMAGQRLVYDNGQLQLVMNDDEENGDDQQDRDDGDAQDSNDESQIELQVSGDEETANAIIAAAHEKGGAFIKVESGEMYRVKSVVSTEDSEREVMSLVTKVGNSFRCKICQNTDEKLNVLMDAQTMTQHLKSKHDVKLNLCQFCGIGIKKRLDFTKHLGTHTKAQKSIIPPTNHRLYQCEMCQKGFNSRTLLLEHMNMHTGLRPYACSVCKKAFASKYTHQAHMKTHQSRPRPFKCRQCDKSFLSQQNLTQHEKTHLGLKPFKCEECEPWSNRRRRHVYRESMQTENMSDTLFIQRFRLNKVTFKGLLKELKEKTNLKGTNEIPLEVKVLCALSFLATGSYQRIVGATHHLVQRTASRCIREVVDALNHPAIMAQWIVFPKTRDDRGTIKQEFQRRYGLPGVIGCIDCTHIALVKPHGEEHLFYNRKGYHSLNVQMICDSNLNIINVNAKYGGATHDSHIWSSSRVESYMRELHQSNEQVWLLGDSGYPQHPWLMTPILNAAQGSVEEVYTQKHIQARNCIERCFGLLKGRWRCLLKDRVLHYHPFVASQITMACCVLHNIALKARLPPPALPPVEHEDGDDIPLQATISNAMGNQNEIIQGRAMLQCLLNRLQ